MGYLSHLRRREVSPGQPSVRLQALIQTTKGATWRKSMAPPNSQARQQRVGLKMFIPTSSLKKKKNSRPLCCLCISDLISSGTAIPVRILWQPSVEQEGKEDVDYCSLKAQELCIPLRDECIRKEVAVSSRVPSQWDRLNVGPVIWDTGDDSLRSLASQFLRGIMCLQWQKP